MTFSESVAKARERVTIRTQAFIGGSFRPARSGETLPVVTPIDGSEIARLAACDAGDVETAVAAARASFEKGVWRNMAPSRTNSKRMLRNSRSSKPLTWASRLRMRAAPTFRS